MNQCSATIGGWCAYSIVPALLQLLGGGITIYGLLRSWWSWLPRDYWIKVKYRKLRGRTSSWSVSYDPPPELTFGGWQSRRVTRAPLGPDATADEKAAMALQLIADLRQESEEGIGIVHRIVGEETAARRQAVRDVRHELGMARDTAAAQSRAVALDGLWIAALGVFVGMIGTVVGIFTC